VLIDTATCFGKYTEHVRHCSGLPADCSLPICRGPKQYTPARYLDFAHALRLKAHKLTTELGARGNPATTLPCSHLSISYNSLLAICIHACTHVHKANQHLQQTHPEMLCKLAANASYSRYRQNIQCTRRGESTLVRSSRTEATEKGRWQAQKVNRIFSEATRRYERGVE
jgi:hypothetical protein